MTRKTISAENPVADMSASVQTLPDMMAAASASAPMRMPIGREQLSKATETLRKYKAGKARLEQRIIENEQFWKQRHWDFMRSKSPDEMNPTSAWLVNVILTKHSAWTDAYPEANFLPREAGDRAEAKMLSSVMPVIMQQAGFEDVWSDIGWYKLKQGTGVYGVFWDQTRLNGLGDIAITQLDLLNLFWEPGVKDIQKSRNFFVCELVDNEALEEQYPKLLGKLKGQTIDIAQYIYDDSIDTDDKTVVVDWYYKRMRGGKTVLHYCKFIPGLDEPIYATENDTEPPTMQGTDPVTGMVTAVPVGKAMSETGLYEHGKYPFIFDVQFPVEGSPCGYGYIDLCKSPQMQIDKLNNAIVTNAVASSTKRWFVRGDGNVNEEEYADFSRHFVHTNGQLGESDIREIPSIPLDGINVSILQLKIDELKTISGNQDVNNGGAPSGITAASAIAAMQETAGRLSKDEIRTGYRAFKEVCELCVELDRQFYELPRQYRILGDMGMEEFVSYSNAGLKPQYLGQDYGVDGGFRLPVFDIEISAQRETQYNKMSQNEFALSLYSGGFFAPGNVDPALACLDIMDFKGKDEVMQKIARNGTLAQKLAQYQQLALALASKYEPQMAQGLAQSIMGDGGGAPVPAAAGNGVSANQTAKDSTGDTSEKEHPYVEKSRAAAQESTRPNG